MAIDESPKEVSNEDAVKSTSEFFEGLGISCSLPESSTAGDFYSDLIRGLITVDRISRGRVTCSFAVQLPVANYYKGLHGGAVAAVVERVATACARTVVAEEKPLFLGELSISYLSSAPIHAELIADGSVVRSGRNLTVVSVEIRLKQTEKLLFTAQATLFHLPASRL